MTTNQLIATTKQLEADYWQQYYRLQKLFADGDRATLRRWGYLPTANSRERLTAIEAGRRDMHEVINRLEAVLQEVTQ